MKIKILETESTMNDEIVKTLIGTTWTVKEEEKGGYVLIDCCGGVMLAEGEYKEV